MKLISKPFCFLGFVALLLTTAFSGQATASGLADGSTLPLGTEELSLDDASAQRIVNRTFRQELLDGVKIAVRSLRIEIIIED